jgi:hypothetical protein
MKISCGFWKKASTIALPSVYNSFLEVFFFCVWMQFYMKFIIIKLMQMQGTMEMKFLVFLVSLDCWGSIFDFLLGSWWFSWFLYNQSLKVEVILECYFDWVLSWFWFRITGCVKNIVLIIETCLIDLNWKTSVESNKNPPLSSTWPTSRQHSNSLTVSP